jgi:hypothetical protein
MSEVLTDAITDRVRVAIRAEFLKSDYVVDTGDLSAIGDAAVQPDKLTGLASAATRVLSAGSVAMDVDNFVFDKLSTDRVTSSTKATSELLERDSVPWVQRASVQWSATLFARLEEFHDTAGVDINITCMRHRERKRESYADKAISSWAKKPVYSEAELLEALSQAAAGARKSISKRSASDEPEPGIFDAGMDVCVQ